MDAHIGVIMFVTIVMGCTNLVLLCDVFGIESRLKKRFGRETFDQLDLDLAVIRAEIDGEDAGFRRGREVGFEQGCNSTHKNNSAQHDRGHADGYKDGLMATNSYKTGHSQGWHDAEVLYLEKWSKERQEMKVKHLEELEECARVNFEKGYILGSERVTDEFNKGYAMGLDVGWENKRRYDESGK